MRYCNTSVTCATDIYFMRHRRPVNENNDGLTSVSTTGFKVSLPSVKGIEKEYFFPIESKRNKRTKKNEQNIVNIFQFLLQMDTQ